MNFPATHTLGECEQKPNIGLKTLLSQPQSTGLLTFTLQSINAAPTFTKDVKISTKTTLQYIL